MICHVCEQEAVGQCKGCGKFYCPRHGNVYCGRCASGTRPDRPLPGDGVDFRLPEYGGPLRPGGRPEPAAAPACCNCRQPATRACGRCGRFYCEQHGGRRSPFDVPRALCDDCRRRVTHRGLVILAVVVPLAFLLSFLFFILWLTDNLSFEVLSP
ncbi:MAG TPA: hypothetical protein VFA26_05700 [Gemmataceae bacterium]|nr:hypothetical protein [Gemmataceae bacterium]